MNNYFFFSTAHAPTMTEMPSWRCTSRQHARDPPKKRLHDGPACWGFPLINRGEARVKSSTIRFAIVGVDTTTLAATTTDMGLSRNQPFVLCDPHALLGQSQVVERGS